MWLHYIILITIYLLYYVPHYSEKYPLDEAELKPCSVFILILSARTNFENRQAIRKTWMQASQRLENVCYVFAIGRECMIPPGDRMDQYGCQELMDYTDDLTPQNKFISNSFLENEFPAQKYFAYDGSPWYTGFGFKILYPVILRRIGIHTKVIPDNGSVHIELTDARSQVFTIEITRKSCSSIVNGFCYMPMKKNVFEMPRLYEAEVFIKGPNDTDTVYFAPHVDCKWVNASVVHYTFGKVNNIREPFDPQRCSLLAILFEVKDVESVRNHFLTRSFRRERHEMYINRTDLSLSRELQMNHDIAYLPNVTDVYRNLPTKLLESLIWIKHHHEFAFILKVDDDSYVNMKRVENLIQHFPSNHTPAILGGFRHHGDANVFGQWADVEYSSMFYPSFPRGAGYLLTENLVDLLVTASPFLKRFQGEDVSIGIWLETLTGISVNPDWYRIRKMEIKCWIFLPPCSDFFIKQQLTSQMMYRIHYNL